MNVSNESSNYSNDLFFRFKRTILDVQLTQTQERLRATLSDISLITGTSNDNHTNRQCSFPLPIDSSLPNLIFLIGIPGSGKSTWTRNYLLNHDPTCVIVSSDAVRMEITGNIEDQTQNELVWEVVLCYCQELLRSHYNVILDATNVDTEKRRILLRRLVTGDRPNVQKGMKEKEEGVSSSYSDQCTNIASSRAIWTNSCLRRAEEMIRSAVSTRGACLVRTSSTRYTVDEAFSSAPTVNEIREESISDDSGLGNGSTDLSTTVQQEGSVSGSLLLGSKRTLSSPSEALNGPSSQLTNISNVISCNRMCKVFTVDKTVAMERIVQDVSKHVNRANVPAFVVHAMHEKFVESMRVLWEEDWVLIS